MARVSFLRPIDHFSGKQRIIDELRGCLHNDSYDHMLLSVAFATSGPLLRLAQDIREWRQEGNVIRAIFGIDLLGTSKQALEFALDNFDDVFITHAGSHSTFHPKFYLFYGEDQAVCYQGSHNLTVGGTETNLEGATKIEMERPEDEDTFLGALSSWESLLPGVCSMTLKVTQALIDDLFSRGIIFDETVAKPRPPRTVKTVAGGTLAGGITTPFPFPRMYPKPPSPIPKDVLAAATPAPSKASGALKARTKRGRRRAAKKTPVVRVVPVDALVIQIVPHPNGEVFLSKLAVDQNPAFFGFPFTGRTKPKKPSNPAYPQRDPDPVVNVTVYDNKGNSSLTVTDYKLNTVFYKSRSEIRITISPELRKVIQPYSVMVMRRPEEAQDYDIEVYNPGSSQYIAYLGVCNQTLPGGGKARRRLMGWL